MTISATTQGIKPGVCTSTNRPSAPFDGQVIYMTDVDQTAVWDGTQWTVLAPIAGGRNVIINGAMQVAQRGTSTASITGNGYYTCDRWTTEMLLAGTWTLTQSTDAPAGFGNSLRMQCTTVLTPQPPYPILARISTRLEGQDLQRFAKGTASAKSFSLSFWVKAFQTGTYICELYDTDNTRQCSKSYTVNTSGTWEYKTVTFPSDTTGAFNNDNGHSLSVHFWLAAGSTFSSGTLNTSWGAVVNANIAVGQTNVASSTSNYFQITGVQLEEGAVATPFEFEDISETLAKCQRYYFRIGGDSIYSRFGFGQFSSATVGRGMVQTPTTMRSVPSSIDYSTLATYDQVTLQAITSLTLSTQGSSRDMVQFDIAIAANGSQYRWLELVANGSTSGYFGASAEL